MLTRAFWDDLLNVHLFPDQDVRAKLLPVLMRFRLKQGLKYGEVYATSSRIEGLALWKHSDRVDNTLWEILRLAGLGSIMAMGRRLIAQMLKIDKFVSQRRMKYAVAPYLHLGPVAVDPEHQGKGYASKLVRPMFVELDQLGLPCYLEAQSESNVAIYEHYGFKVLAKGTVPDTDIPHWDMMRLPLSKQ
jgi:predicted GNAT family N-acyltransferase